MRQTAIGFRVKRRSLEGILTTPEEMPGPFPSVVVCHPHPKLGGNMENAVVTAICRAADRRGIATLRFNFRGVGGSEGEFDNGKGEQEDVRAALDIMRRWPGIDGKGLALAGYSFGASVVLDGLKRYRAARSLALIAPSISSVRSSQIGRDRRPKLFVAGRLDRVVPSTELQSALDEIGPSAEFLEMPRADHTFSGCEQELAEQVVTFLSEALTGKRVAV